MATSVGGFFATLTLKADKGFDDAKKNFDELEKKIRGTGVSFGTFVGEAIKGLTAIGAAAIGAAYEVSKIQGKNAVMATSAGMKASELNQWTVAMGLVGQSADDLASHLATINDAMTELAGGHSEKWVDMANKLAYFRDKNGVGIDVDAFKKASQTERMNMVADIVANSKGDQRTAMINQAGGIFGESFKNMLFTFDSPKSPYKNIHDLEKQSSASATKTDPQSLLNMLTFNRVLTDFSQISKTVGDSISDKLQKPLQDMAIWLEAHKGDFAKYTDSMSGLTDFVGQFFGSIGKALADIFINNPVMKFIWSNVAEGADLFKHFDEMKGLTGGDRDIAKKVRETMGWGLFDDRSILLNALTPQFRAEKAYNSATGNYLSKDQIEKITSSAGRMDLLGAGYAQAALNASEKQISFIESNADRLTKSRGLGAVRTDQDIKTAIALTVNVDKSGNVTLKSPVGAMVTIQ